jgi:predicted Fe-Mo cluster-binding NifX family protein
MKIAIPTQQGNSIDQHFGHCEFYSIFTVENNKVIDKQILQSPQGCGCKSNIAYDLEALHVRIMLAGGIGNGAVNKLNSHNIEVIRNCSGDVDTLVNDYLAGKIADGGTNCAAHDEHHSTDSHVCNH